MINKNKIHDIDLVAVIQHNGHNYEINTDGLFRICISDEEFKKLFLVFNNNYRPVFKELSDSERICKTALNVRTSLKTKK